MVGVSLDGETPNASDSESASAVVVDGVSKVFPSAERDDVVALDEVSFAAESSEFVCLLGPSGCGKSTLLNLIADLEACTEGSIRVHGKSPAEARRLRTMGLVFQDAVLLPWRTVEENIALPLEISGISRPERYETARKLADFVGLTEFIKSFPHQLSGGMQQRVGIARALSHEPRLLLMDEPFGALDAITRDRMNLELLNIWGTSQKTIIFVTHSIEEAVFLADKILVMSAHPGRIVAEKNNPLPRPRDLSVRDSSAFTDVARELRKLLETS